MQLHQSTKCSVKSIWGMVIMLLFPLLTFGLNRTAGFQPAVLQSCKLSTLLKLKHGDIHEQIAEVTAELKEQPKNAALYYKRASLYHGHGSLEEGLADYQRAMSLGYSEPDLYYFMARLYREKKEPQLGLPYINQFTKTGHSLATGLIERARIYAALHQFTEAIADYDKVLAMEEDITVDHYLELAEATLQIEPDHPEKAIAVLDRGIERLGPLVVFQLRAIEMAQQNGDMTGAMTRMDLMIEGMARRESYYFKKGEMLQTNGKAEEAQKYFQLAGQAINQLPPNRRNTPAILELQTKIDQALNAKGN